MSKDKANIYTTLAGVDIPISPISPTKITRAEMGVEKSFRKKGEPIDPPSYSVEILGGGTQEFELDEDSIDVPDDVVETTNRRIAWTKYQEALARMKTEQFDIVRRIVLNSIQLKLPEDETWIKEQEELYIEVPENPRERWLHWLETEILMPQDVIEIIAEILTLSSTGIIPEEEVAAATQLFRRELYTQSLETEDDDTPEGNEEEEGEMETLDDNAPGDSSESLGDDPE